MSESSDTLSTPPGEKMPSGSDNSNTQILLAWLDMPDDRQERSFLEAHPELLTTEYRCFLKELIATSPPEKVPFLRKHLNLLKDTHARGSTIAAIREAYVNVHGGFNLDLPPWLEEIKRQFDELIALDQPAQTAATRVQLLQKALLRAQQDRTLAPEMIASLYCKLAMAWWEDEHADLTQSIEAMIEAEKMALHVYTLSHYPSMYASRQNNLGMAYRNRIDGEQSENVEQAIRFYMAALAIFTPDDYPEDHAMVQLNLGMAYQNRHAGEQSANLEHAIACYQASLQFYTRATFAETWAYVQYQLARLYAGRLTGEKDANQEHMIACYHAALQVYTCEGEPERFAAIQWNLGIAYHRRVAGDRRANQERAIACYLAALHVYTRDAFPEKWACTQEFLGYVYDDRIAGERRENQEQVIACYTAALQVYTCEASPEDYARVQKFLGGMYQHRIEGEQHLNRDQAISCYKAALRVYTREAFPEKWADLQRKLGSLYGTHMEEGTSVSLPQAITCFKAALEVYTPDAFPDEWDRTQELFSDICDEYLITEWMASQEQAPADTPASHPSPQFSSATEGDAFLFMVLEWLNLTLHRDKRRFLEAHPGLLHPRAAHLLVTIGQHANTREALQRLYDHLQLLYDVLDRGGTLIAIHEACIDRYGGFALDLPPWLEAIGQEIAQLDQEAPFSKKLLETRNLLRDAIAEAQWDASTAPELLAELYNWLTRALYEGPDISGIQDYEEALETNKAALEIYTPARYKHQHALTQFYLGNIYLNRIDGDRGANLEQAIACYETALQVCTQESFPENWADIQDSLGEAYLHRIKGERHANLEQAIAYFQTALQVYTRDAFPAYWAAVQGALGATYRDRIEGERRANLEQAIAFHQSALQVRTLETFPLDWAATQTNLGVAYSDRIEGERRANLELSIACYQAALRVYTPDAYPVRWAMIQNNLGNTYRDRIEGEKRANLEQAIACYQATLQVRTPETLPLDWAATQTNLGVIYRDRIEGERRTNLEQSIAHLQAALQVYTHDHLPIEWAMIQHNLGTTYSDRIEGERRANLEQAIACYQAALQVRMPETLPLDWAGTMHNSGLAYVERIEGERSANLEQSITHLQAALQVYTHDHLPIEWAMTQHSLGTVYQSRIEGEKRANLEQAIACYQAALQVHTRDSLPVEWAMTQHGLGNAYLARIEGEKRTNLERAIACYQAALQIRTRDAFPVEWAKTQYSLGSAYLGCTRWDQQGSAEQAILCYNAALHIYTLDAFPSDHRDTLLNLAAAEAKRENWLGVHTACEKALAAEALLVRLGAGARGRDAILKEGANAATHNGFALTRSGQVASAAVAIEAGRALGLTEALLLSATSAELISDTSRRTRYTHARQDFIKAQADLNDIRLRTLPEDEQRRVTLERTALYHKAQRAFDAVIAEIQTAQDPPHFLEETLDAAAILRAAVCGGPGHALVYLVATPWGGIAVGAFSAQPDAQAGARFALLDLPALTSDLLADLLHVRRADETRHVLGGYLHAQEGKGLEGIRHQWPGKTFREVATTMHAACAAGSQPAMLERAAQALLASPQLSHLVDQPFDTLNDAERATLASAFGRFFLQLELQRCSEQLLEVVMKPLFAWLRKEGATSITLIPCGWLAAFPFTSLLLTERCTLGEPFPISVAPSARSLLRDQDFSVNRSGVYALGNPSLTDHMLEWSDAEALTVAKLSRTFGLPTEVAVQRDATRAWLIQALRRGLIIDASCHGSFDPDDFLRSALHLAYGQRLHLASLLSHEVDVRGLRLLMLSACQTAVLDLRGAVNEVRSLAVGMLQAGAQAVLAALWEVDERATFLLLVRFVQEWLPHMNQMPPALALMRAQQWLRTVKNRDLREWRCGLSDVEELLHMIAGQQDDPDTCPYADPVYWAGFQIVGW